MEYELAVSVNTFAAIAVVCLAVGAFLIAKRRPNSKAPRNLYVIAAILVVLAVINGLISGIDMN